MKFNYLARTYKGEARSGTIEAPNQSAALKTLQGHNLIVLKLEGIRETPLLSRRLRFFERVKRREVFVFFRQLAVLVSADVPLVQSLRALSQQIENPSFQAIIFEIANDVDGGTAFSEALAKHPKVFSIFSINLIKSGEVVGRLQESLNYLADHLEKEYYLITRVRGAMIYPAFILGAFIIVGVIVIVTVIPQLTVVLVEAGQDLPLSTRVVIAVSNFMRSWGWLLLLFLAAAVLFAWRFKKTETGKALWDRFILKIPFFGKILLKTYLARLADNLNALVKGGVPIIQSLDIAGQVIGNTVFQEAIWQTRDDVKMGQTISSTLEKYKEFPPLFCQMVKTGERGGKLDTLLEKLSVFYSKEVDRVIDNLSKLIEPVLIVCLGIGVGILIFAVFMPIYNLVGAI